MINAVRRVLVIDDNPEIHNDFRKVLSITGQADDHLDQLAAQLFDTPGERQVAVEPLLNIQLESAYQGEQGIEMALKAAREERPYCAAFVDVRMPPGIDGIQTIKRIWQELPDLQCVVCTAYSDYQWDEISRELDSPGNLLILKKPFDIIEVLQIIKTLGEKADLARMTKAYQERLKTQLRLLVRAQAEQRVVNRELEQARRAAEKHSQAKSLFLANMSHELRTPLNGVIGWTELLLCTPLDEQQHRYASTVRSSAELLLELIDHILDLSKIEAGKVELEEVEFELNRLVESVVHVIAHRCQQKGLLLTHYLDPSLPRLLKGDQGRIRQILLNLANNAAKFTERGEVAIRVALEQRREQQCRVRFTVRDTGIGIPADRVDRLFRAFSQVDSSTTRKYGGTGLGLALSKQLCELMGGDIGFESTPGQGSTFWFSLPLKIAAVEHELPYDGGFRVEGLQVLLVDQNPASRQALADQFVSWGCELEACGSWDEVVWRVEQAIKIEGPPQVIVVDLESVDQQLERLQSYTRREHLRDTVVLGLNPLGRQLDRSALTAAGIAGVLTKPLTQSEFYDCLVRAESDARERQNPGSSPRRLPSLPRAKHAGAKILLAEDNEVNRNLALEILKNCGYHCDAVCNGKEALQRLQQDTYDIVLMDVHMPEMDGLEVTRAVRTGQVQLSARAQQIPIVALTAGAMQHQREQCAEAGMSGYLTKPFRPLELIETLERYLADCQKVDAGLDELDLPQLDLPAYGLVAELQESEIFDYSGLLERCCSSEPLARQTLQEFLKRGTTDMERIEAALANGDAQTLANTAHSLCGAAATVGANPLAAVAARMEDAADAQQSELYPTLHEELQQRWEEFCRWVRE